MGGNRVGWSWRKGQTMKGKRYSGEQIVYALKRVESGDKANEMCRQPGVSEATILLANESATLSDSDPPALTARLIALLLLKSRSKIMRASFWTLHGRRFGLNSIQHPPALTVSECHQEEEQRSSLEQR